MENKTAKVLADSDQPVSFAELFFDLVFVYAVTQVVYIIHGHFDWAFIGRAILVFWLVWWAWTQFTWALNAANTKHHLVQLGILLATAIAFFMAVSIPHSFGGSSMWFAIAYVVVRVIGLSIYSWVTWQAPEMRAAVKTFGSFSIAGLIAVLAGGYLGGNDQYLFWGLAILLDLIAAWIGGRNESWNLHAGHFTERHGLFVIIALGETLIIAASAVSEEIWNGSLVIVSLLSVGATACLWWIYFFRFKEKMEHTMASKSGSERSKLGRDAFSLLHFPMIFGLILYAYAIEEAMLHPDALMADEARISLGLGLSIYASGLVLATWRAMKRVLYIRIICAAGIMLLLLLMKEVETVYIMSTAFAGLMMICVLEEFQKQPPAHEQLKEFL